MSGWPIGLGWRNEYVNFIPGTSTFNPLQKDQDFIIYSALGTAFNLDGATGNVTFAADISANNLSGSNTGDQTSIVGISGTTVEFNTALSDGSFATGGGTATGSNTGDQTSIVGITGTMAQFDTAVTDGNIQYDGDVHYVGTTSIANNRASASQGLAGITSLTAGADFTMVSALGNAFKLTDATGNIDLWSDSVSGETPELKIYGFRTADALRSLEIGVGVDAADTVSFDGLSNYQFDGVLKPTGNLDLVATTSTSTGVISKAGTAWIHDYADATADGNNFFAGGAGNFTLSPAGGASTLASDNNGIGYRTLDALTTGSDNVAIGTDTASAVTTGAGNVALGNGSLFTLTTAQNNLAIGSGSLYTCNANDNVGVGVNAARLTTSGTNNVAIGPYALYQNTTGAGNTCIGSKAGQGTASNANEHNIFIGYQAADSVTTGSDNIVIGYDQDLPAATTSDHLNIGGILHGDLSDGTVEVGKYSAEGETPEFKVSGFKTGDALRTLEIGVGTDADDTASFDGVSNYYFDGNLEAIGSAKIGDAATNYASFATDGELTLTGTARVKKEFEITVQSLSPGGSGATLVNHGNFPSYEFGIDDDMVDGFELPADCDTTADLTIEIYWAIDEAYATASGEVQWALGWRAIAVGEDVTAGGSSGTIDYGDVNIPAAANVLVRTTGTIAAANISQDDLISFNVSRVALDDGSNPTAEPYIVLIRVEYTANKLGEAI